MATRIANDICRAVQHYRYRCEARDFQVGASIGVALMSQSSGDVEALIAAADEACYDAKRKGRSRVEVATTPAPE